MESTQLFNVPQGKLNPKPELRMRRRGVNGLIRDQLPHRIWYMTMRYLNVG